MDKLSYTLVFLFCFCLSFSQNKSISFDFKNFKKIQKIQLIKKDSLNYKLEFKFKKFYIKENIIFEIDSFKLQSITLERISKTKCLLSKFYTLNNNYLNESDNVRIYKVDNICN